MKAILICPSQSPGLAYLTESTPLVCLPFLGENYLTYWLEHLAHKKVTEVRLIGTDRSEQIQAITGGGERWGMNIEITRELRDIEPVEARQRFRGENVEEWLPEPEDAMVIDHLPGRPEAKLFQSYADWFQSLGMWLPKTILSGRIGLREIQPGVWAGRRVVIHSSAKLIGPCWLGDMVRIGKNSVIGPNAFLEDQVVVEEACEVADSWIGPDTFLGPLARLKDSLAWGSTLINWRTNSHTTVPDAFLMCSLDERKENGKLKPARKKIADAVQTRLVRPWDAVMAMAQKIQS